jgi:hypothetical protein
MSIVVHVGMACSRIKDTHLLDTCFVKQQDVSHRRKGRVRATHSGIGKA